MQFWNSLIHFVLHHLGDFNIVVCTISSNIGEDVVVSLHQMSCSFCLFT